MREGRSNSYQRIRLLRGIIGLLLPSLASSQGAPPLEQERPGDLPSLEEAREIGRAKSAILASRKETTEPSGPLSANLVDFKNQVEPVLTKTCVECHGPKKAKGKFRIDTLDPNLLEGGDVDWWLEVLDVLSNGEMPPDDAEVHLSDGDLGTVIDWLGPEIQKASTGLRNEGGHSSFRRMARYEYNYALQDLLGLSYSLVGNLPSETASEDGFKNSSEMLHMSARQLEI